jgi:hypothetical protein
VEAVNEYENIEPFFTIQIPPMVDVMSSLVFAFTLGLGMAFFGSTNLKNIAGEFKDIIVKTIEGGDSAAAAHLHIRNIPGHDLHRTGCPRDQGLHRDYRRHIHNAHPIAGIPILRRWCHRWQKPFQDSWEDDAGLFHRSRHFFFGGDYSRDAGMRQKE